MIGWQAIINMAVVTGSIPATGVPLPFISYGGSSLVPTLAGVGILLNISQFAAANRRAVYAEDDYEEEWQPPRRTRGKARQRAVARAVR